MLGTPSTIDEVPASPPPFLGRGQPKTVTREYIDAASQMGMRLYQSQMGGLDAAVMDSEELHAREDELHEANERRRTALAELKEHARQQPLVRDKLRTTKAQGARLTELRTELERTARERLAELLGRIRVASADVVMAAHAWRAELGVILRARGHHDSDGVITRADANVYRPALMPLLTQLAWAPLPSGTDPLLLRWLNMPPDDGAFESYLPPRLANAANGTLGGLPAAALSGSEAARRLGEAARSGKVGDDEAAAAWRTWRRKLDLNAATSELGLVRLKQAEALLKALAREIGWGDALHGRQMAKQDEMNSGVQSALWGVVPNTRGPQLAMLLYGTSVSDTDGTATYARLLRRYRVLLQERAVLAATLIMQRGSRVYLRNKRLAEERELKMRKFAAVRCMTRLQALLRAVRVRKHNEKVAAFLREKARRHESAATIQRGVRAYRMGRAFESHHVGSILEKGDSFMQVWRAESKAPKMVVPEGGGEGGGSGDGDDTNDLAAAAAAAAGRSAGGAGDTGNDEAAAAASRLARSRWHAAVGALGLPAVLAFTVKVRRVTQCAVRAQSIYRMGRAVKWRRESVAQQHLAKALRAAVLRRSLRRIASRGHERALADLEQRDAALTLQRGWRAYLAFLATLREHCHLEHGALERDLPLDEVNYADGGADGGSVAPAADGRSSPPPSDAPPEMVDGPPVVAWLTDAVNLEVEKLQATMRSQRDELIRARLMRRKSVQLQERAEKQLQLCRAKQAVYLQAAEGKLLLTEAALVTALEAAADDKKPIEQALEQMRADLADHELRELRSNLARCDGGLIALAQLHNPSSSLARACRRGYANERQRGVLEGLMRTKRLRLQKAVDEKEQLDAAKEQLLVQLAWCSGSEKALTHLQQRLRDEGGTAAETKDEAMGRIVHLRKHERELSTMVAKFSQEHAELARAEVALDELGGGIAVLTALLDDRRAAVLRWLEAQRLRCFGLHVGLADGRREACAQRRLLRDTEAAEAALADLKRVGQTQAQKLLDVSPCPHRHTPHHMPAPPPSSPQRGTPWRNEVSHEVCPPPPSFAAQWVGPSPLHPHSLISRDTSTSAGEPCP